MKFLVKPFFFKPTQEILISKANIGLLISQKGDNVISNKTMFEVLIPL